MALPVLLSMSQKAGPISMHLSQYQLDVLPYINCLRLQTYVSVTSIWNAFVAVAIYLEAPRLSVSH